MGDDFTVSVTGARELLADLNRAQSRALPETTAIAKRGAQNIKTDWARAWSGLKHAPALGRAVSYDLVTLPGSVNAEVGPDKDRPQGALGNLVEYGSVNNAPIPGGLPALDKEAPRTERALGEMAARLLEPL